MARIRTIKPEFPHSESLSRVSRDARLLFVSLWTIADDEGRLRGNSRMLASLLFPYDDDAPGLIDSWLDGLEREGCIQRYRVDGSSYIAVRNWLSHQKIDRPSASKLPPLPEHSRALAKPREPSSLDLDQGRDQGEGAPRARAREGDPEDPPPKPTPLTPAIEAVVRMRRRGLMDVTGSDPRLLKLLAEGVTPDQLDELAVEAVAKQKGWAWLVKALEGRRRDAEQLRIAPAGPPWHETRKGVEAKGVELGLGAWDEYAFQTGKGEPFRAYERRVFAAAGFSPEVAA